MRGIIGKRTDGQWECKFTMPNGKSVKSVYGKSRPEVHAKMEDALDKAQQRYRPQGRAADASAQFTTTPWIEGVGYPRLRPKERLRATKQTDSAPYQSRARRHHAR